MILTNHLTSLDKLDREVLKTFLIILNPFAPHITEELNEKLGFSQITGTEWPTYDKSLINDQIVEIGVQFNGKMRGTINIDTESDQDTVLDTVKKDKNLNKHLKGRDIRKVIYIKGRIVNFVI